MSDTVVNLPAVQPQRREIQNVVDAVPILDTARFEHMQRVARVMASSSMIPETLRTVGKGDAKEALPFEQVLSNCFLVVNQAARWGMDPFAVISCCAVVHGRLAYEGKLVSAVLAAKLNLSLHHYFTGESNSDGYRIYLSDQPFTAELIEQLKPGIKIPGLRLWDGSVGEWKTTGAGTPWTPKNYPRMLIYRGTRDWTRIYESALMLGVYSDDEMLDLMEDARARRAIPVSSTSLVERLAAAKTPGGNGEGFSHEHVTRETGGETETEAQREAGTKTSPPASTADEALASAQEPVPTGSEEAHDRMSESASPPDSNSSQATSPVDATKNPAALDASPGEAAGEIQGLSEPSPADDDAQAGVSSQGAGLPSSLPQGWGLEYAAALRRAQKPDSLAKYGKQFWETRIWPDAGPDRETALAIFAVFKDNFGNRDQIDALLRELV